MSSKTNIKRFTGFAVAALLGGEIVIRGLGLAAVPLYDADNKIGYIPKADQSGTFLLTRHWVFNNRHMGVAANFDISKGGLLLVGDSVVMGGNRYEQSERLGPKLAANTGAPVWPIAAGSWGLQNEIQYLKSNPDVVDSVDRIIFVLNSEDFEKPSQWSSPDSHPKIRPTSHLLFVIKKYIIKNKHETPSKLVVNKLDAPKMLIDFVSEYQKPIEIWLYPARDELGKRVPQLEQFKVRVASSVAGKRIRFHDVSAIAEWKSECYLDEIHPTPECTGLLSKAIASAK